LASWSRRNVDIAVLPFILLAVVALMMVLTGGGFLSSENLGALMAEIPELGLLSLGMMITMLTAGINLSLISSTNLAGVSMGLIMTQLIPAGATDGQTLMIVLLAIVVGMLVAAFLGFVNGVLIAYVGLPAFLTTLGTMILYEGITLSITKGFVISGYPPAFEAISAGNFLGVPYVLLLFVAGAITMSYLLNRRPLGRQIYMIGSNEMATRYSSIDTRKVLVKTYVISGLFTGLAAIIMTSRFNSANARQGSSLQLLTILIAVLGGTDPNGGFGKVSGMVLALLIMQFLASGFNLLGISSFMTTALWGIMLIVVLGYRFMMTRKQMS
jgi:simple sugar transport system permease protein